MIIYHPCYECMSAVSPCVGVIVNVSVCVVASIVYAFVSVCYSLRPDVYLYASC